jgi:hypothetical protein
MFGKITGKKALENGSSRRVGRRTDNMWRVDVKRRTNMYRAVWERRPEKKDNLSPGGRNSDAMFGALSWLKTVGKDCISLWLIPMIPCWFCPPQLTAPPCNSLGERPSSTDDTGFDSSPVWMRRKMLADTSGLK